MSDYIERYWRDATPEDAIKEPPMVARFRDDDGSEWKWNGRLLGIDRSVISGCLWCAKNAAFRYCQVYDAPDPGEGWRLIDTDKDKLQIGDEALLDTDDSRPKWETLVGNEVLGKRCIVRRRIEQSKPEPRYEPFRWEDREQLRGRWIRRTVDGEVTDEKILYHFERRSFGAFAMVLVDHWRFLDTGEPVGRKIQ